MYKRINIIILSLTTMFIFTACSLVAQEVESEDFFSKEAFSTIESEDFLTNEVISTIAPTVAVLPIENVEEPKEVISTIAPTVTVPPIENVEEPKEVKIFSDEEVQAITRTLAGECYDDKLEDKRKVVEVILNRVSNEKFEKTVLEVVSAKGQFCGYWKQSRPISESDIQIAEETLERWYANNCEALSDYLFFHVGPNRENVFRVKY